MVIMVFGLHVLCLMMWEAKNFVLGKLNFFVNRQQSTIKTKTNRRLLHTKKRINFGDEIGVWANVCHLKCNFENYKRKFNLSFIVCRT